MTRSCARTGRTQREPTSNRPSVRAETSPDRRLWTKRDVAQRLQVTTRTVERLRIPCVALPARGTRPIVRYDPGEVKARVALRKSRTLLKIQDGIRHG